MKSIGTFLMIFPMLFFFIGCKDSFLEISNPKTGETNFSDLEHFAIILSKATFSNAEIREFIKEEASKMIDRDYDVFYPTIKDKYVTKDLTFRDILISFCNDRDKFEVLEKKLPLLTIYIPELPSGFNAIAWNTKEQIPFICPNVIKKDSFSFYNNGEIAFTMSNEYRPGFPVLVVKNNERIRPITNNNGGLRSSLKLNNKYEFIDESFDGRNSETRAMQTFPHERIPHLVEAYLRNGC